jgi:predicted enzyme related to lactoylglutathione lyase
MTNPVTWVEIYVNDMARAKAFYEAVFGIQLSKLDNPMAEMWAFSMNPEGYGASGALVQMPGFAAGGNSVLPYFGSQDCTTELARVIAAGGRIQKDKTSIGPYGHIALAFDSEGNMFGLHSME